MQKRLDNERAWDMEAHDTVFKDGQLEGIILFYGTIHRTYGMDPEMQPFRLYPSYPQPPLLLRALQL
jgi:hypothetical protein